MIGVEDLHKSFGAVRALDGVSLFVGLGEVVCVIGPSGSGKSTLLRCINFLEEPTRGLVRVDGRRVGYVQEDGRTRRMPGRELARMRADIGMVFQLFYLWPHMTALENVILGLTSVRGVPLEWPPGADGRFWRKSGFPTRWRPIPSTFPAGSASASPSPGRLPWGRR